MNIGVDDYFGNRGVELIGEQFTQQNMSRGISNFETEKVFKEINNEDINKNFLGVFPPDKINKFIMFEKMMLCEKYPFIISNTDRSDEGGTHWRSILNISPKSELLLLIRS